MINAIALLATIGGTDARVVSDEDAALVARHAAGDATAFAAIYRAHVAAVYRRLSRILGPVPEREDLTQDVFLALHRALPGFRGEARLSTLIHRIAVNRAFEYLRRKTRRPATLVDGTVLDELVSPAASPAARASARQDLAIVFATLARIKPKKRIAFLLRVVDGLSFEEIGELVDATPETVAKRVQHGQRELDALLARAERSAP
ncbi:MAG: RNA polymerase sigma factor [Kofleriaceae bacterium]